MKYEYLFITLPESMTFIECLNHYGNMGWKFINVIRTPKINFITRTPEIIEELLFEKMIAN